MKTVLITGATSGIGLATAQLLSNHDYRLVLCGRNTDKLKKLEKELGQQTDVTTLEFDVRDKEIVAKKIKGLPAPFDTIDILINNAGIIAWLTYSKPFTLISIIASQSSRLPVSMGSRP